jgi:hypothetical protein
MWTRQIRETGRLELVPARWPWALMALAAAMAALAGLGMYGDAGDNDVQRTFGILFMIGGVVGIPMAIWTFMRGKQSIVIDQWGIQMPPRPLIPWPEVHGADVFAYRGSHSVMILVSDGFLTRFHANTNPLVRFFSVVNKRMMRVPAIYLPSTIKVNPFAFAAWIHMVAKHHAGVGRQW